MGSVTKSQQNNITSPTGNSLAVFIESISGEMKVKDVMGNIQPITDFIPKIIIQTGNYGLFSQIEDSVPITATTVKSSLIGNGVGSLSVPANAFQVGDSFSAHFSGTISCVGSATIDIKVETVSGILLCDTGIIDLSASTLKSWSLELQFTVRSLGVAGVASIASSGIFSYIRDGGLNFEGYVLNYINSANFDTTIENELIVTGQWNSNSGLNSIFSRNFVLQKTY